MKIPKIPNVHVCELGLAEINIVTTETGAIGPIGSPDHQYLRHERISNLILNVIISVR